MRNLIKYLIIVILAAPFAAANSITVLPWKELPSKMIDVIPEDYITPPQLEIQPELIGEVSASIGLSYIFKTPGKRIEAAALLLINSKGSVDAVFPLESKDPLETKAIVQIAYTWRFKPGEDANGPVASAILCRSSARISKEDEILPAAAKNPYGFSQNYQDFIDESGAFMYPDGYISVKYVAQKPKLITITIPPIPTALTKNTKVALQGSAVLFIDEEGYVTNILIRESSSKLAGEYFLNAFWSSRFTPAIKDEAPTKSVSVQPFSSLFK